jgi:hypothetical protein
MPELSSILGKPDFIDSYLRNQLDSSGILPGESGPEWDRVKEVNFGFELDTAPSLRELIAAISQVDRGTRLAAGLAACLSDPTRVHSRSRRGRHEARRVLLGLGRRLTRLRLLDATVAGKAGPRSAPARPCCYGPSANRRCHGSEPRWKRATAPPSTGHPHGQRHQSSAPAAPRRPLW